VEHSSKLGQDDEVGRESSIDFLGEMAESWKIVRIVLNDTEQTVESVMLLWSKKLQGTGEFVEDSRL